MYSQQDEASFHDLPLDSSSSMFHSISPPAKSCSLSRGTSNDSSSNSSISQQAGSSSTAVPYTSPLDGPHYENLQRLQAQISADQGRLRGSNSSGGAASSNKRPRLVHQKKDSSPTAQECNDGLSGYSDGPYPMSGIVTPHRYNDILLGRGGGTNFHPGNVKLRAIIEKHRETYITSSRKEKPVVAMLMVKYIRQWNPPGRFLKKDSTTGSWYDVGDEKGREKVSQLFREKDQLPVSNMESRLRTGRLREVLNELEVTDASAMH